jgi:hypothetical protein
MKMLSRRRAVRFVRLPHEWHRRRLWLMRVAKNVIRFRRRYSAHYAWVIWRGIEVANPFILAVTVEYHHCDIQFLVRNEDFPLGGMSAANDARRMFLYLASQTRVVW